MYYDDIPNTNIKIWELKDSHLETISRAYTDCGLNIHGKTIYKYMSVDSINETNKELNSFEVTPNPFGDADNKIVFNPKYCKGNLYVNVKIINGKNLQEKFDAKLKDYFLHGK